MVRVPAVATTVGTSVAERQELAQRFDCHPTWLGDDLPYQQVELDAFWIDRYPVTNAEYLAFVEATEHPRPAWWARWGGVFPAEYADHPVVGVSGTDATAYAQWLGKRLPTAAEWEVAMGHREGSLFAWGDDWPGPLALRHETEIWWELPGTRAVGSGDCGQSAAGAEDFAGQSLEWVSTVRPHHGVQFQLLKGASWFHEDPLNFRTAAGWYAFEGWRSAFTGFRCALDGDQQPMPVPQLRPTETISVAAARRQLEGRSDEPVTLAAAGGTSRFLSIRAPRLGSPSLALTAPETVNWNGVGVMTWRKTPDMTWTVRTPQRAAYEMLFEELRLDAEFLADGDTIEQRFTAVNLTDRPGRFQSSSCFSLQNHPQFYDCEQLRTFALNAEGEFVPLRSLSRGGDCVRWISGPNVEELGSPLRWAVLAVVSRDGSSTIATGRRGSASGFSVATNTLFTCLHADATTEVPPAGQITTRQWFWFIEGDLDALRRRVATDLAIDSLDND